MVRIEGDPEYLPAESFIPQVCSPRVTYNTRYLMSPGENYMRFWKQRDQRVLGAVCEGENVNKFLNIIFNSWLFSTNTLQCIYNIYITMTKNAEINCFFLLITSKLPEVRVFLNYSLVHFSRVSFVL